MNKLTRRQSEILAFIQSHLTQTGFPPTRAEISEQFGFKSPNAAEDHLRALAKKGMIELTPGASRGIRMCQDISTQPVESTHPLNPPPSTPSNLTLSQFSQSISSLLIPVVGHVAAGHPILATEHIDKEIPIDPSLFDQTPDYFLKVRGESMKDVGIMDGDYLAVRKQSDARNGQIVVARIEEDVTVKRFIRKSTHIELLPENSEFNPIIVSSTQAFCIEGIAVGLIRSHPFM